MEDFLVADNIAYQPAAAQTDAKGLTEERTGGADAGMVGGKIQNQNGRRNRPNHRRMAVDWIDCFRMRFPSKLAELVDSNPVGKLILWRCRQKRLPPKKHYHDCYSHHQQQQQHHHHHSVVDMVDQCWSFLNGIRETKDENSDVRKDRMMMGLKDLKMEEDGDGSEQTVWLDEGTRWLCPLGKVVVQNPWLRWYRSCSHCDSIRRQQTRLKHNQKRHIDARDKKKNKENGRGGHNIVRGWRLRKKQKTKWTREKKKQKHIREQTADGQLQNLFSTSND